jgi:hypothetical protein
MKKNHGVLCQVTVCCLEKDVLWVFAESGMWVGKIKNAL